MLLSNKDISKKVFSKLQEKDNIYLKNITLLDIEKLLKYYGYIISIIMKRGGFITLPIYKNHQRTRCIRIAPIERNIVYKLYRNKIIQKAYIIKNVRKKQCENKSITYQTNNTTNT